MLYGYWHCCGDTSHFSQSIKKLLANADAVAAAAAAAAAADAEVADAVATTDYI